MDAERTDDAPFGSRQGRIQGTAASWFQGLSTHSWLWLLLLFTVETVVFYVQMADQIAPFFPMNFDQGGYANYTYQLFEAIRERGWSALGSVITNPPTATGTALIIQGALLSLIGGATRTTLISINLIYFIALQIVVFLTVMARTHSLRLAGIALALLLALRTFFNPAGGIFDFRMDFAAQCLYGVWCCLLLWSNRLAHSRVTIAATLVAMLLVATRSFTLIYCGSVLLALWLTALVESRRAVDPSVRAAARLRARNTFWSGAALGLLALPLMFMARQKIYEKYVVGHVLNDEKYIRAEEMNVSNLWEHLAFYPKSVAIDHIGPTAAWLALALVVISVATGALLARRARRRTDHQRLADLGDTAALALTILVPIALLAADIAKSTVVGGIVAIPLLLITTAVIAALSPWLSTPTNGASQTEGRKGTNALATGLTVAALTVGFSAMLLHANARQHSLPRSDLRAINALNEAIADYAIRLNRPEPAMSLDRIIDYVNIGTVAVSAYERDRAIVKFRRGMLGDDIFAVPRDEALKMAADSDILVLTDPQRGHETPYPFNAGIKSYWDDLHKFANDNMMPLVERDIEGIPHRAYVKPVVTIGGLSGGWVTSAGLLLTANAAELKRWPWIRLEGEAPYEVLGGEPKPRAVVMGTMDQAGVELPARLSRRGSRYEVTIDARSAPTGADQIRVRLTFDRFFVPKQRGINSDTRELVVFAPASTGMSAAAP